MINTLAEKNQQLKVKEHKLAVSSEQKQKIVDKHSVLLSKLCADCQKVFSDYYNITTFAKEIKDSSELIGKLKAAEKNNSDEISQLSSKQNACIEAIDKCQHKIKELTAAYTEATTKISLIDAKITSVENDISKAEKEENPFIELLQSN